MNKWTKIKQGKTREVWKSKNGKCIALVAGDNISACDRRLQDIVIPDKGILQTKMSAKWFKLIENKVPDALLASDVKDMPRIFRNSYFEGRTTEMIALKMLPIEAVVRGYVTGSMWEKFCKGGRKICDFEMPEGIFEAQRLEKPIYTPTTKAGEGEHDQELTFDETAFAIERAGFDHALDLASLVRDYSLQLYQFCSEYAESRGLILADTKFEFGVDEEGILRVTDELCTPDSSRFWRYADYIPGDSQISLGTWIIRDWLKQTMEGNKIPRVPENIIKQAANTYGQCYKYLFG